MALPKLCLRRNRLGNQSYASSPLPLVQAEEFHPRMPTRRLAARASNSEDSHRSQSEAAADDPGPHTDEEAGGPGCCRRASPCLWQLHHALESSSCKKDSEELAAGLSEKTAAGVSSADLWCRLWRGEGPHHWLLT